MVKVSVLVPICNVQDYLEECLWSLKVQTLKEIQFICINDGSKDASLEILEKVALDDPRFVIVNKKNTGYGNSLNVGLKIATGDYIAIVESDDYVDPNMFWDLYLEAVNSNAQVVKSNYYEKNSNLSNELIYREILKGLPYRNNILPTDHLEIFDASLCIWSAIYNRNFLIENDIWFNETPGASFQDISFNFKILYSASSVWLVPKAYYVYRRDNVNSSVNSHSKVFAVRDEYKEIDRFLLNKNVSKEIKDKKNTLKIRSYLWNYWNLASPYQYAFLLEMNRAFAEDMQLEELSNEGWSEKEWNAVCTIKQDPMKYFKETGRAFNRKERCAISKEQNRNLYEKGLKERIQEAHSVWIYLANDEIEIVKSLVDYCAGKVSVLLIDTKKIQIEHDDSLCIQNFGKTKAEKDILLFWIVYEGEYDTVLKKIKEKGYTELLYVDDVMRSVVGQV